MKHAGLTDRGRVRELNEDNFLIDDNIFAVADGMGGHRAGEVASTTALREVVNQLKRARGPRRAINRAFNTANKLVINESHANTAHSGMGTTLTVAVVGDTELWLGHIGDSRAYLWRNGSLSQLTDDHSLVADLVRAGKLPAEEAAAHPRRHIITRAIGGSATIKPDIQRIRFSNGDRLMLCTDGLTNTVAEEELARIAGVRNLETACRELVDAANDAGGPDNITVVLVELETAPPRRRLPWWAAAAVGLAAAALLLGNFWLGNTFHLRTDGPRVAIYRGLPGRILGYRLYRLDRRTDVSVDRLPAYYRRRLDAGIVVGGADRVTPALRDIRRLGRGR